MKIVLRKALIVSAFCAGFVSFCPSLKAQHGVLREVYVNITGGLPGLTNNVNFPDAPALVTVLPDFEAPENIGNNYGQRLRGYLAPPISGNYVFWISSDDQSALFLSSDEQPQNRQLIASVTGAVASGRWDAQPNQRSSAIRLEAGKRYYIEALMVEGTGDDHLAVRWQIPTAVPTIEEPIPGSRLFVELIPAQIVRDPVSVRVTEGQPATFSVQVANIGPISFQWRRNGVVIPGETNATLTLPTTAISDNGSSFTVAVTNEFGGHISNPATLRVDRDVLQPAILFAHSSGDAGLVTVSFSEPVDPASAVNIANYQISGAQVLSATLDGSGRTVILRTTPLQLGTTYTISVSNVRDLANQPNTIEPDSRVDVLFSVSPLPREVVFGRSENPGPSSRRTGLVISEIMYHPSARPDGRNLEYIELYNSQEFIESDIGGYRLTGDVEFTFPAGTFISAESYLVVAAAPTDVLTVYGLNRVLGPFTGARPGTNALPNDRGRIQLRNDQNAVLLEIEYDSRGKWPVAADGTGHSLVLTRASYGERDPRAWGISTLVGGSPGSAEPSTPHGYEGLVINEFLAHTDDPQLDFVELFNYSTRAIDLAGLWLSDDPETNKFLIPANTVIPPLGLVAFNQTQLGFALSSSGERIFLRNPSRTRLIDAVSFEAQANGVPTGRYPDGNPRFAQLTQPTSGSPNAPVKLPDVIFNEIMYNPLSGDQDEEYIELYNRSGRLLNIGGWRLDDGIGFTFPQNTIILPDGYLVVAKDLFRLRTNHTQLSNLNSLGNFGGNLSNGGERVALTRPEPSISTNLQGGSVTNIIYVLVDEVEYDTGGRWGLWSDGGGSSLELVDRNSDNDFASNWIDSDESQKSTWTTIERRGILDHGSTNAFFTHPTRNLHVLMMGAGEALLDNVQVIPDGSTNIVSNPGFENGLTDWIVGGTHDASFVEYGSGSANPNSLHIHAVDRGNTTADRLRARLTQGLTNGSIATLRADVRWLRGSPEILLRLHGNYLEAEGRMNVPANLGTPGAVNSRAIANAGPVISQVTHHPVLPVANQNVRVSAQITDPARLALALLYYRVDPNTNFISVPMVNNGAGFLSADIPGQADNAMIAFYVEAIDSQGQLTRFPADAPVREAMIHIGDRTLNSDFGTYRIWISDKTRLRWIARERASNKPLDATFVYNNERIVYNIGTLYSGSPFHWNNYNSPLGNSANYEMLFPDDDVFLGETDFVLNLPSNLGSDQSGVREQIFFWMADQLNQPHNYRRYHHLFINGLDRGNGRIFEDAQQPNRDFIEQWYPEDSEGLLHKIEDWFEFSSGFSRFNLDAELIGVYTTNLTTGARELKKERYRWWFAKRAVRNSAHDYSELLRLVDAVNRPVQADYIAKTEALIDIDEWMGAIALRHAAGDWDAYGYTRGKNMYMYKPENGKWQLLHWDVAFAFGLGDPPDQSLFDVTHFDGTIDEITLRMMNTPPFRRAYYRALYEAAHGPFNPARVEPIINARYNALTANGIGLAGSPQSLQVMKNWIAQRQQFMLTELASVSSGFSITSNSGNNFTTNRNTVLLTGIAPVQVKTIRVNGVEFPVTWTGVTTWELRLALPARTNVINIEGFDSAGNLVSQASDAITITYTGAPEQAPGRVVFSEIQYNPFIAESEFVELHNISRNSSFDLSNYRINGLNFVFPSGTVIPPSGFLVLARDAVAFGEQYGFTIPIAGEFSGTLDNGGETLTLLAPSATGAEIPIASVRYDNELPWPMIADGTGASLQLVDPAQDSTRVGNWASLDNSATPGATNAIRSIYSAFPLVWVNEVDPTDTTGTQPGWVELYNSGSSAANLAGLYLTDDYTNLTKWAFPAGASIAAGQRLVVRLDGRPDLSTPTDLHAGFTIHPDTGSIALTGIQAGIPVVFDYLSYENLNRARSYGAFPEGQAVRREIFFRPTLGAPNDLSGGPVQVFFNEWMAANSRTIRDPDDQDFDDWFELYNAGSQPADLTGYVLTDNLTNRTKFTIPAGTVIPAGGFLLVWADEERATNGQLHVNFRLSASGEDLALIAPDGTEIHRVSFGAQQDDISEGLLPNGSSTRQFFTTPTPGASNSGTLTGLRFTTLGISQGSLRLEWQSVPGKSYDVQYKNSLSDAVWTPLRTVVANDTTASTTDTIDRAHRFYRIQEL